MLLVLNIWGSHQGQRESCFAKQLPNETATGSYCHGCPTPAVPHAPAVSEPLWEFYGLAVFLRRRLRRELEAQTGTDSRYRVRDSRHAMREILFAVRKTHKWVL